MHDHEMTKEQLLAELQTLRQQLADKERKSTSETRLGDPTWRTVISNAPVFIALVERNGTIVYLNHAQPGLSIEESIGKTAFDFTLPEYHGELRASLDAAFVEQRKRSFTSVAAGADGENAWYDTYVAPLVTDGEVKLAALVAVDVTRRKATEIQLSEERARAQEYINIAGVALLALDPSGRIELLNRTGHRLLGYPEGSLIGRDWFDFVPEQERDRVEQVFSELMTGKIAPIEFFENSIITRWGERRIIAWHNSVLTDREGRRIGTLSSGTDVTAQTLAQESLRKAHEELEQRVQQRTAELTRANRQLLQEIEERRVAEAQLQAIYNGLVDGMLVISISRKQFVRVNAAICEMLGYSERELLNLHADDIHPEAEFPRIFETFNAHIELDPEQDDQPQSMVAENVPMLRKDGSVFYVDISASLITYGGEPCLIGFFHDTTERRVAEERLQREHRLLRDLLKSQDRERQLIAYEIHDGLAQQLVGAIMQFESVAFLNTTNSGDAQPSCEEGLTTLRKALSETRRLISGLRPPVLDELGVIAAIGHFIHDMAAPEKAPQIEYRHDVQFDRLTPTLENTIYRIVQECLTNAQRYSQSDRIRVELSQEGEQLRVAVTDWGVGFDATHDQEGRFGLEGIKERARLLGGSASVHSEPGEGTRVLVRLPLSYRKTEPSP